MKILLDTNFLIDLVRFKIDLSELRGNELYVLDAVLRELEKISEGRSEDAVSARLALKIVKGKRLKILKSKERQADLSLLEHAEKGYAVATQDLELKRKLRKIGAKVVCIRQKKYLMKE